MQPTQPQLDSLPLSQPSASNIIPNPESISTAGQMVQSTEVLLVKCLSIYPVLESIVKNSHCSDLMNLMKSSKVIYKVTRPLLMEPLPTSGPDVMVGGFQRTQGSKLLLQACQVAPGPALLQNCFGCGVGLCKYCAHESEFVENPQFGDDSLDFSYPQFEDDSSDTSHPQFEDDSLDPSDPHQFFDLCTKTLEPNTVASNDNESHSCSHCGQPCVEICSECYKICHSGWKFIKEKFYLKFNFFPANLNPFADTGIAYPSPHTPESALPLLLLSNKSANGKNKLLGILDRLGAMLDFSSDPMEFHSDLPPLMARIPPGKTLCAVCKRVPNLKTLFEQRISRIGRAVNFNKEQNNHYDEAKPWCSHCLRQEDYLKKVINTKEFMMLTCWYCQEVSCPEDWAEKL